jgi:hypothetical protein
MRTTWLERRRSVNTASRRSEGALSAHLGHVSTVALVACAGLLFAGRARGQADLLIPNQMHTSLVFELHSVKDEIELYEGDPQYLFRLDLHPLHSMPPKIDFSNTNQAAVLRVRDLWLFEGAQLAQDDPEAEAETDPDLPRPEKSRGPVAQGWTIQLSPASPTDFVLRCDGAKGVFDFTDLPVHSVHLLADTTRIQVDFKRPNPVRLERFKLTVREGRASLHGFLNARAKSATLTVDGSKFELELTGEPPADEFEVFVEGSPQEMHVVVARDAGLHVEGPASVVARFDHEGIVRRDQALENEDWASRDRRVRLYFSRPVPDLEVSWSD